MDDKNYVSLIGYLHWAVQLVEPIQEKFFQWSTTVWPIENPQFLLCFEMLSWNSCHQMLHAIFNFLMPASLRQLGHSTRKSYWFKCLTTLKPILNKFKMSTFKSEWSGFKNLGCSLVKRVFNCCRHCLREVIQSGRHLAERATNSLICDAEN